MVLPHQVLRLPAILAASAIFMASSGEARNHSLVSDHALNKSVQYRPAIHFSPEQHFMNDPNGLLYDHHSDEYHMYYQLSPNSTIAGNLHWGHATSKDLYHWKDKPIALTPTVDGGQAFSGSMVNDVNNTSGLFPKNGTQNYVAVYTQSFPDSQVQALAYSLDGGLHFKFYENNPVLDLDNPQFRDPQVQWYEPQSKWVMTVTMSREHKIAFYESKNLKNWNKTSEFTAGIVGVDYECPNLVPVRHEDTNSTKWVLFISINPGMPLGGSGTQYFVGDFDGYKFKPNNNSAITEMVDLAKDNYALQYINRDHPALTSEDVNNATYIGWFSNWQYCQEVPTEPWRSAMTLPRQISLKRNWLGEDQLVQKPRGLEKIRSRLLGNFTFDIESLNSKNATYNTTTFVSQYNDTIAFNNTANITYNDTESHKSPLNVSTSKESFQVKLPNATAIELLLDGKFSDISNSSAPGTHRFIFELYNSNDESIEIGIDPLTAQLWLDRGNLKGFQDPFFTDKFSVPLAQPIEGFNWRVVLDGSLLEIYADDGFVVGSAVYYAEMPLTDMRIKMTKGGAVNGTAMIYTLNKTMERQTLFER